MSNENQNSEQKPELYPKNGEITFIMPSTNAIGALKNADTNRKLTVSYQKKEEWIAEQGKPVECFFLGFKEATDGKGNTYFLAKLHDGAKSLCCWSNSSCTSVNEHTNRSRCSDHMYWINKNNRWK